MFCRRLLVRGLSSSQQGLGRLALRRQAETKKRLREAEMRRAQRLVGGAIAATGVSLLTYGHADYVLTTLRDLDTVGTVLVVTGCGAAVAPSLVDAWRSVAAARQRLAMLHAQLASTQRAVERLSREIQDDENQPSRVLHLRNLPSDATNDEIDTLFPQPPSKTVLMLHKSQALVQLDSIHAATAALEIFERSDDLPGPTIRNHKIFASFSIWPELNTPAISPTRRKASSSL